MAITAMPLVEGKINLGVGRSVSSVEFVHCEVDGSIDINWRNGSPATNYTMVAGEDRLIVGGGVTVVAGIFTVS